MGRPKWEAYLLFLKDMQEKFGDIKFEEHTNLTFAKAIDEYNYMTITKILFE